VGREVQREVKRRDERARAHRHALPHAAVAAGPGGDLQLLNLAVHPHRFFGGDAEGVDQPRDLAAGVFDGLARLDAERLGQLFGTLGEACHAVVEHVLTLVGGHPGHGLGGVDRRGDGLVDGRRIGEGHAGGGLAGVLVGDHQVGVGGLGAVGEVVGVSLGEHGVVPGGSRARV